MPPVGSSLLHLFSSLKDASLNERAHPQCKNAPLCTTWLIMHTGVCWLAKVSRFPSLLYQCYLMRVSWKCSTWMVQYNLSWSGNRWTRALCTGIWCKQWFECGLDLLSSMWKHSFFIWPQCLSGASTVFIVNHGACAPTVFCLCHGRHLGRTTKTFLSYLLFFSFSPLWIFFPASHDIH